MYDRLCVLFQVNLIFTREETNTPKAVRAFLEYFFFGITIAFTRRCAVSFFLAFCNVWNYLVLWSLHVDFCSHFSKISHRTRQACSLSIVDPLSWVTSNSILSTMSLCVHCIVKHPYPFTSAPPFVFKLALDFYKTVGCLSVLGTGVCIHHVQVCSTVNLTSIVFPLIRMFRRFASFYMDSSLTIGAVSIESSTRFASLLLLSLPRTVCAVFLPR